MRMQNVFTPDNCQTGKSVLWQTSPHKAERIQNHATETGNHVRMKARHLSLFAWEQRDKMWLARLVALTYL